MIFAGDPSRHVSSPIFFLSLSLFLPRKLNSSYFCTRLSSACLPFAHLHGDFTDTTSPLCLLCSLWPEPINLHYIRPLPHDEAQIKHSDFASAKEQIHLPQADFFSLLLPTVFLPHSEFCGSLWYCSRHSDSATPCQRSSPWIYLVVLCEIPCLTNPLALCEHTVICQLVFPWVQHYLTPRRSVHETNLWK